MNSRYCKKKKKKIIIYAFSPYRQKHMLYSLLGKRDFTGEVGNVSILPYCTCSDKTDFMDTLK